MKRYRALALSACVISVLATGALSACGSSSAAPTGDDDDSSGDGDDASADGGGDATNVIIRVPPPDGSTSKDGGVSADGGADSAATPEGGQVACNPSEMADPTQVFVSSLGSPTSNCVPQTPCSSIQAGIVAALAHGQKTIYVDQGTYPEQLTLSAGIAVRGAWSRANGWTPICDDTRLTATKLQPPTGTDRSIIAINLGGSASLEAIDVEGQTPAQPGQSLYGIFASGSTTTLSLTDVSVLVPAGGSGRAGTDGAPGVMAGAPDCGHGVAAPAGATAATAAPSAGARVEYSAAGATSSAASSGTIGGNGQSGLPGTEVCGDAVTCSPDKPEGVNCAANPTDACGSAAGGCGGTAGGVGTGGGGGGSSIALYAFDAQVVILRGQLIASVGGSGGNGGAAGAAGGATNAGGAGSVRGCTACNGSATACACGTMAVVASYPAATGNGTPGAVGVPGAGGAGGDSFGFYANAANVTYDQTSLSMPAAASGGMGSPAGPAGMSGNHN